MKANLHTHSFFSDGSESPERIAELAEQAGVGIIALSDHNTFAGYERFAKACSLRGINPIKAVEIDCVQHEIGFKSELLAYFPHGGEQQIQPILDQQTEARRRRVTNALERSKTLLGINDSLFNYDYFHQWVVEMTGYDLWCAEGVAPLYLSNKQFHQFLINRWGIQLPEYNSMHDTQWWKDIWAVEKTDSSDSLYSTIRAVTLAGGYAVLPHFGIYCKFNSEHMSQHSATYLERLRIMQSHGLWGMEIHPYRYKPTATAMNAQVRTWAQELGLHLTAGSDYHGDQATHNIFDSMWFDFDGFGEVHK